MLTQYYCVNIYFEVRETGGQGNIVESRELLNLIPLYLLNILQHFKAISKYLRTFSCLDTDAQINRRKGIDQKQKLIPQGLPVEAEKLKTIPFQPKNVH